MRNKTDITQKPYYKCFICPDFRVTCGGEPTRDLTIKQWCEKISDTMDYFHLTNAYVTEKAESSLKTTERIRAGSIDQDILRGTARRYELAVFGTANKYICARDIDCNSVEKIAALQAELEAARKDLVDSKEEDRKKIDFLMHQLELKDEQMRWMMSK